MTSATMTTNESLDAAPKGFDASAATPQQSIAQRTLGRFLRAMRDRSAPPVHGVSPRSVRRTPGLRREEVALAAGISLTWYTWLEQGRPVGVSPQTLTAITRALGLSEVETEYARSLAATAAGTGREPWPRARTVSDEVRLLVDALEPKGAYVVNAWTDIVYANATAQTVLAPLDAQPGTSDNLLRRLFLDPEWRTRIVEWPRVAAGTVARYRRASAALTGVPEWEQFIDTLCAESDAFGTLWYRQRVAAEEAERQEIVGPDGALRTLTRVVLFPTGDHGELRVVMYVPT